MGKGPVAPGRGQRAEAQHDGYHSATRLVSHFVAACAAFAAAARHTLNRRGLSVRRHVLGPFAAGGPTDLVGRILGGLLSAGWGGKAVLIDYRQAPGPIIAAARSSGRRSMA
jgi:tripartite-type tricarboxylate transporter receptor subunit TctC